ncbi:hypothetical protein D3C73_1359950 [compost metagenome]
MAAYIAASAARSSESKSVWLSPSMAMPTLAPTFNVVSPRRRGSASELISLRATCPASSGSARSRRTTMNSSPLKRPNRSLLRRFWCRRVAAAFSSASPVAWPKLSLMFLKPSRSMNSMASEVPRSRASSMASDVCSPSSTRLGRPVSRS